MSFDPEKEVLFWLTKDPNNLYWAKVILELKGQNPFDAGQGALFNWIQNMHGESKNADFDILMEQAVLQETPEAFSVRIGLDSIKGYQGTEEKFVTALTIVKERYIDKATIKACHTAVEIVKGGVRVGKNDFKGAEDAWKYLVEHKQKLADVRDTSVSSGDMFSETESLWERYKSVKEDPSLLGRIPTGFRAIDEATSGGAGGEFWVVGAYAGEGKSTLLRNMAYFMSVKYGKNVVYATTEMTRKQIAQQLISRHSYSKKFQEIHEPIIYKQIRDGRVYDFYFGKYEKDLGPDGARKRALESEAHLKTVMDDLKEGRESGEYGMLDILQVPGDMTIPDLADYMAIKNKEFKIDVLLIDYAMQFQSHVKTNDRHEMHAAKLRACKQLALDFGTREQLLVITAHQITRADRDDAEKRMTSKRVRKTLRTAPDDVMPYSMRALAGSAEAERSADVLIWMLLLEKWKEENIVRVGLTKNREGMLGRPFNLRTDFSCSYLGNMGQ